MSKTAAILKRIQLTQRIAQLTAELNELAQELYLLEEVAPVQLNVVKRTKTPKLIDGRKAAFNHIRAMDERRKEKQLKN